MRGALRVELQLVVAEGILARDEAEGLCAALPPGEGGLLAHLEAKGRISAATAIALRAKLVDDTIAAGPPSAVGDTVDERKGANRRRALAPTEPPPSLDGFPVASWDRYEPLGLLGQGGMGRVFLAKDRRLDRKVALKFVRGDDPDLAHRIVGEARAQARVDDDQVCKVYDVGEVDGQVYIAMQYVEGRTLGDLVDALGYEQKALVMRGAALGVHAAHRAGLIHRDLKPSNIMVEEDADGELHPFVMDFGIARDHDESHTATGTVLGTPEYMAPEQARGEVKQLDRRADVYSLGATMYRFLTGKPPVTGENMLEIVHRLTTMEPAPPRTHDRELPPDLDAIVMKCLEKDRTARYDSARALADDLGRFLDGEPVAARATTSVSYRLGKWARRHWRALAVTTLFAAVIAGAIGYVVRERREGERQAARRAALARDFAERVERIEALARYAALAPAHDVRPDRAHLRMLMDALAREVAAGGDQVQGSGHYALGRGYLALGEDDLALVELEAAWARGYREPRAAYALALTLGRIYQRELAELQQMPGPLRDQRRAELEALYRDPARTYLLASAGTEVPSAAYVSGLLAYYDGRHDDALRELTGIERSSPALAWFYEAPLLRGQILRDRALANRANLSVDDLDAQLAAARAELATATAIGESEPSLFRELVSLEREVLMIEIYGRGRVDEPYQRGRAAADRALLLDPDSSAIHVARAQLTVFMVEARGRRGEDVSALLAEATADAGRALELQPDDVRAKVTLARCLRQTGEALESQSKDPAVPLGRAIELLASIPAEKRDATILNQLGLAHKIWADSLDARSQDASAHRREAIAAYENAIARNDKFAPAWFNLGINYVERARAANPTSTSVDEDVEHAFAALERGRALQPQSVVPDFYEGDAAMLRAASARAMGHDPGPHLAEASALYEHGITINPKMDVLHNGIAIVELERAQIVFARGDDPDAHLVRSEAAARASLELAPETGFADNLIGQVLLLRGQVAARGDADPSAAYDGASASFERALARIPDHRAFSMSAAQLELARTTWLVERGRPATDALARARTRVERLRSLDPDGRDTREAETQLDALARRVAGAR